MLFRSEAAKYYHTHLVGAVYASQGGKPDLEKIYPDFTPDYAKSKVDTGEQIRRMKAGALLYGAK